MVDAELKEVLLGALKIVREQHLRFNSLAALLQCHYDAFDEETQGNIDEAVKENAASTLLSQPPPDETLRTIGELMRKVRESRVG
ncbi:MAG: hypothetical protein WB952_04035 [Terriglobales bacterium]